jgi:hypothetical protein
MRLLIAIAVQLFELVLRPMVVRVEFDCFSGAVIARALSADA